MVKSRAFTSWMFKCVELTALLQASAPSCVGGDNKNTYLGGGFKRKLVIQFTLHRTWQACIDMVVSGQSSRKPPCFREVYILMGRQTRIERSGLKVVVGSEENTVKEHGGEWLGIEGGQLS